MNNFILLTDKRSEGLSQLVLVSKRHISEVRPVDNPITDGALVVMSNGREIETIVSFDKLTNELRS